VHGPLIEENLVTRKSDTRAQLREAIRAGPCQQRPTDAGDRRRISDHVDRVRQAALAAQSHHRTFEYLRRPLARDQHQHV